ncbi:MAG: membrane protein insertase YidC [Methylococcales bacterium]|nr:membrane protein insertase YidC [Methylococcales bacterium]
MDNVRFLLIVVLASLTYMLYDAWQQDYGPKPEPIVAASEQPMIRSETNVVPSSQSNVSSQPATASTQQVEAAQRLAVINIQTDLLALEINPQGGVLQNLDLRNHPKEKENTVVKQLRAWVGLEPSVKDLSPVRLLDTDPERLFLAQNGLISASGHSVPNHQAFFQSEQHSYRLADGQDELRVPLRWTGADGVEVSKVYVFKRGSYLIDLEQTISNRSDRPWQGRQYLQLLRRPYQDANSNTFIRTFTGAVTYTQQDKYQKISFDDIADDKLEIETQGGWIAMIQHYFASAWIPVQDSLNHFYTKDLKDNRFVIGSFSEPVTVAPEATVTFTAALFTGPKIQPMLEKVAEGLELTTDYSWLTIIAKPIYWLLNQFHGLVGNWGVAIIFVTLVIKLLFFKLSQTSYHSMAKMRKLQPKLKALQERYADDRQRLNQEMMELYKREKVNPLGGCLPILVQIPVFISLYWVLVETVELRQAPFMLWIQDLSTQDPFYILPLLMGITMKIQQSLNPAPVDPVQAQIIKMFPVIFTVFFLFFPAGLVLYWVVNNTLSIAQQWVITRQIERED